MVINAIRKIRRMSKKKPSLEVVGKTDCDREVFSGVFKLIDTHGLPLTIILDILEQQNKAISIAHFYEEAIKAGWKESTIDAKVFESVLDVHGPERLKEFKLKIEEWKKSRV